MKEAEVLCNRLSLRNLFTLFFSERRLFLLCVLFVAMTKIASLFTIVLLLLPSLGSAEVIDAIIDDVARSVTQMKRAKSPDEFTFAAIKLDSKEKLISKSYRDGRITNATHVALGTIDEKRQTWVAGKAIEGGVASNIFMEKGKVLRMLVDWDARSKEIQSILVTNTDAKLLQGDTEFDAILQGRDNQNLGGRVAIAYLRLELNDKSEVVKTFGTTSTSVDQDTKIAMGVYNDKEKKWEAGEPIANGLWNEMFGDFRAKTVYVRVVLKQDHKGIAEILVKKIGDQRKER